MANRAGPATGYGAEAEARSGDGRGSDGIAAVGLSERRRLAEELQDGGRRSGQPEHNRGRAGRGAAVVEGVGVGTVFNGLEVAAIVGEGDST